MAAGASAAANMSIDRDCFWRRRGLGGPRRRRRDSLQRQWTRKQHIGTIVVIADAATPLAVEDTYGVNQLIAGQGQNCFINDDDGKLGIGHRRAVCVPHRHIDCRLCPGSKRSARGVASTRSVRLRGGIDRFSLPRA